MAAIREVGLLTKQGDKKRFTCWLPEDEVEWLEQRAAVIKMSTDNECEILKRVLNGSIRYALAYKNGYFDYDKNNELIFKH